MPDFVKLKAKLTIFFANLIFLLILTAHLNPISAQSVSSQYNTKANIKSGELISVINNYARLTNNNNISQFTGIANQNSYSGEVSIAISGIAYTYVSNSDGNIQKGDYITSSNIPGIGEELAGKGVSIGKALSNFNINSAKKYDGTYIEKLPVLIDINYINVNTGEDSFSPLAYSIGNPQIRKTLSLAQLVSIIFILIASVILAMTIIARSARNTIKNTSRNPLNKSEIIRNFYKVAAISIGIVIAGILISYIITLF